MGCNDKFFIEQTNIIKETWAKNIINKTYSNISFMSYVGSETYEIYNDEDYILTVKCEDDLDNTFKKTIYALKWIENNNIEYDYIFRTNTSTYINVPLLNAIVQQLTDENIVYASDIYSLTEGNCPEPLNIYGRGNGILISKKMVNVLIKESINLLYLNIVDDMAIGNILNSYWIKQNKDYTKYIKGLCHAWYKAVDYVNIVGGEKPDYILCTYDNDNGDFDFLKKFVTIQTKMYYHREDESDNYRELNNIMINNIDDNIEETVKFNMNYGENPNIFIGSILGYIPFNRWKDISRDTLWKIEANNKASNDIYRYKFVNKPLL